jgi:hypothetical protein
MVGFAGSIAAEGSDVRLVFVVYCVGSGLCDELITCLEESFRMCMCACV